jgi:IS5 family transposase
VTQGSTIAINVLVMNLQKLLELLFMLFAYWLQNLLGDGAGKRLQTARLNIQIAPA